MRFRGENPVYKYGDYNRSYDDSYAASYGGVVTKTTVLLGIIAITALYMSSQLMFGVTLPMIIGGMIVSPIVALIMVIVAHRKPEIAIFPSIIYALCEGVFLGLISTLYASYFGDQIVQMALIGTFGVLGGMLFLFATGIIRVGAWFRKLMFSMLIGLVFTSLILFILALSGISFTAFYDIYFAIIIISVIVSSLYLLVDFDTIQKYVEAGAPKSMEWSLSLGLTVTIVWLYIELLRLFAILAMRAKD